MPAPFPTLRELENADEFVARHIGIEPADEARMLPVIGSATREELIDGIVPAAIRRTKPMNLPAAVSEADALAELKRMASKNKVARNFIGQGYYGTHTPGVILRNILENPAWYTAYTPYQAEISQGRMEALVNFQTMVCDLTGMAIANASMLDEATAAAEAMTLAKRSVKSKSNVFLVAGDCHPQTIEVLRTRAGPLGIEIRVSTATETLPHLMASTEFFGALAQYPGTTGQVHDLRPLAGHAHACGAALCVAADLLALTLLMPPGEWDADIVCGTTQRFGMPMCNGGPHAAYLACRDSFKRSLPGRLVGVSVDAHGAPAYRLALQTREQHIRREKATSNICTAQVLPAVVASMYAVYHGPEGLTRIAQRVAALTAVLADGLEQMGRVLVNTTAFDSLTVKTAEDTPTVLARADAAGVNLRHRLQQHLGISLDETSTRADIETLWALFVPEGVAMPRFEKLADIAAPRIPEALRRTSNFLAHPVFNTHKSETAMLRYIRSLSDKDLALDRSMIPLGSCTMKLNATSEMIPITWPEFANIHPFAPADQLLGYAELDRQLLEWLCEATGYAGISLQPNAGSQGEYAGLLAIKAFHDSKGEGQRNICLIPSSAHGTNPASAQMAGMQVVVTACDAQGNVDMDDLQRACEKHGAQLAAVMITYPSTHGVFETRVKELCELVHSHGGRVYVDGANMNALVGVAAPGEFGGDVSHLNLHKTFCIPHGGGGPGVGPVCVVADLVPFLPGHATSQTVRSDAPVRPEPVVGAVSAAPLGNAAVLPISWMYCRMMGAAGLQAATETAILSANYISARLKDHYPTLYASPNGHVAHECILDLRPLKETSGVTAEDVAKRLIDYGFHAPTLSFPVPGTLMVEPTESEPLAELDRFIEAMIAIRGEIRRVEEGVWPKDDNPLKHAPHTAASLLATEWKRPYARELAAYPLAALRQSKYWSPIGRVDNVYGDRNLFCSCLPVDAYDRTDEAAATS
ncbi:aminomethyl-transferring glycine dehydrogenase [Variovorax sp. RHLX14]|uniref:aminomethyl-transferring glycine dehydrogenase n=1 Tax=Variovorax sp. RHLX14 TaxID=1259731 RepID=UPI003F445DD0